MEEEKLKTFKEMNSKQELERMREIEELMKNKLDLILKIELKQEAKEIYEKFKYGCDNKLCIGNCYNCQEIKESWERINGGLEK